MNNIEISKALALAIGWRPEQIHVGFSVSIIHPDDEFALKMFDYCDPLVIWPIAERFGCFPSEIVDGNWAAHKKQGYPNITGWELFMVDYKRSTELKARRNYYRADTAAKCVALAVIGGRSAALPVQPPAA